MRPGSRHSTEVRQKISERVRAGMASPEVRKRISERTKEGMRNGPVETRQRQRLHTAWNGATNQVRKEFLAKILAPLDREAAR